jgi:hypothetical protein
MLARFDPQWPVFKKRVAYFAWPVLRPFMALSCFGQQRHLQEDVMANPIGDAIDALAKALKDLNEAAGEAAVEKATADAAATKLGGTNIENEDERRELNKIYRQAFKAWLAATKKRDKAALEVAKANAELQRQIILAMMK